MPNLEIFNKKIYLFDLWGVIHDGRKPYDKIIRLIKHLKKLKKRIYIVSNSSSSSSEVKKDLKKMFININYFNKIFTSGDFASNYLKRYKKKKFYSLSGLGPKNLKFCKENKIILTSDPKKSDIGILISNEINIRESELIGNINNFFLLKKKIICINPDYLNIYKKKCMGFYANKFFLKGGNVTCLGKPEKLYFNFISKKIKKFKKRDAILIGDTYLNDICGANKFGIDSVLFKSSKINQYIKLNSVKLFGKIKKNLEPSAKIDPKELEKIFF